MGNRPDRVQMKLEGVPAKPGDTVKLTLTPPHDGQALVTVEGDRMLWSTWVAVKATGTQVEIPINKDWKRHDLYVAAAVFRPGQRGRPRDAGARPGSDLPVDCQRRTQAGRQTDRIAQDRTRNQDDYASRWMARKASRQP